MKTRPEELIAEVEEKYGLVLKLAEEQYALLEAGRIQELPPVIQEKAETVEAAGKIMSELREYKSDGDQAVIREGIAKLSALVEKVMEVEDRCQKLYSAPITTPKAAPAGRVASMYQKQRR